MNNQKNLFEFLCILIDIQIKKYVALPTIGIGPDARLNGQLVFQEVNELLVFANQLLIELEHMAQNKPSIAAPAVFLSIFNQVKFYLEQEHLRGYAGWLLDENNIHTPLLERVNEQIKQLKELAYSAHIDFSPKSNPVTEIQAQTEKDSVAIAFYILDLAKKITNNPLMELDKNIPRHAGVILRRNATTRYCLKKFAEPINELHKKCDEFLQHTNHIKSEMLLEKKDAKVYEAQHRDLLGKLLARYQKIEPTSNMFSPEHEWYKIGKTSEEKSNPKSLHSSRNTLFFVAASAVVVCMLIAYFMQSNNEYSLYSRFKS